MTQRWGEPGIKRTGCSLKRLKCGFSTSEGVQPQNGSTAGAFAAPLRVLSQKNMTGDNVLIPVKGEKITSHTHKTVSWYLLGVLFQIWPVISPTPSFLYWISPWDHYMHKLSCKPQYQGFVQKYNLHSSSFFKECNNKDISSCLSFHEAYTCISNNHV